ncbi:MAG TPA: ribonuclease Y [Kofleriaceae bacterium]|nr:ribonuclease Y [Kofleriaceae bacterium]
MDALYLLLAVVAGAIAGVAVARALGFGKSAQAQRAAEAEAKKILAAAEAEGDEIRKAAAIEGRETAFALKSEAEDEIRGSRAQLAERSEALGKKQREIEKSQRETDKRNADLSRREKQIAARENAAEAMVKSAESERATAQKRLEEVAGLSAEAARQRLEKEVLAEAQARAAGEVRTIEEQARAEAASRSKQIIATAIQRYAGEMVSERTVAVVPLPSDDLKGRLIGREGRNIRALEAAAGIDMIIDDTSESITLSCFNPVRREIARMAVTKLVSDGRIHPTRIEEVVRACEREVDEAAAEAGEQAVFDLGLHRVHPELVRMLGRLKFRHAYTQNVLQHSVEVGFLAGLMAAELGESVKAARRAGLLHDIGKAVDHENEGSHAEVGAQVARKHGESPRICQAIAAHDGDPAPQTVLDHIVDAANLLSKARPGARRELLASYVKRLEDLEKLCQSYEGVSRAHALLAGREIRVMVENDRMGDDQALMLSKELARRIESEASYPGQVRVVVIRETRASDYAR